MCTLCWYFYKIAENGLIELGGIFQHFFLFFCQFQIVVGVTKADQLIHFLCDISIFEYKVWTKKCSNFILFAVTSAFFTLFYLNFFDDVFLLNPPFFLPLKIFRRPKNFSPTKILLPRLKFFYLLNFSPIFKSLQKVGVVSPKKWGW